MRTLRTKLSSYFVELFILFLGLASFATLYVNHQIIGEVTESHVPLIDAAMEIKLEATTSHLWLEEFLTGDPGFDIDQFWYHLDQSDWYARSMLQNGSNAEGNFIATRDPELRRYLQELRMQIETFREIAKRRLSIEGEKPGLIADHEFDSVFHQFIDKADRVETKLQQLVQS